PNMTNVDQTEHEEEEDVDERFHTPSDYELIDDEKIHDKENINDEERMDEEEEDEYRSFHSIRAESPYDTKWAKMAQGKNGLPKVHPKAGPPYGVYIPSPCLGEGVPDEQHLKTTSADEGTSTILGVPDVPIYESENKSDDDDNDGGGNDNHDDDSVEKRRKLIEMRFMNPI
nr:hypothetical protein [Tanacetum cinerariifolium]